MEWNGNEDKMKREEAIDMSKEVGRNVWRMDDNECIYWGCTRIWIYGCIYCISCIYHYLILHCLRLYVNFTQLTSKVFTQ